MGKKIPTISAQAKKIAEKYPQIDKRRLLMQVTIFEKKVKQQEIVDPILIVPHEIIPLEKQMNSNNICPRIFNGRLKLMSSVERSSDPYVIAGLGMISKYGESKISTVLEKEIERNKDFKFFSVSEFIAWTAVFGFHKTNEILLPMDLSTGRSGKNRKNWDIIFWKTEKVIKVDLAEKTIRQRNSSNMKIPFFTKRISLE